MRADVLTGLPTKQGVGSSNLSGRIKSSENTGASANAEGIRRLLGSRRNKTVNASIKRHKTR